MTTDAQFMLSVGGALLLGLITTLISQKTALPRVTLLLILGVLIGDEGLGLVPDFFTERFDLVAEITLIIIGFLMGGKLTSTRLRSSAVEVFAISGIAALGTTLIVTLGLLLLGVEAEIAILLGCIAAATDATAVYDVVAESERSTAFTHKLVAIVALDDIWALLLFGAGIAVATSLYAEEGSILFVLHAFKEIGGAIALGVLIGAPAAFLTGRIREGQPMLLEGLGIVFICGGLAVWWEVSYLIAALVLGMMVANFAKHHDYPFHAIEGVESPFMIIFFVLAGASLEIGAITTIGLIGGGFVVLRAAGKYFGSLAGSFVGRADPDTRKWMGLALMPQAGVSIGMALVASTHFPEYKQLLLSVVITTTILFEIVGPIITRMAVMKSN